MAVLGARAVQAGGRQGPSACCAHLPTPAPLGRAQIKQGSPATLRYNVYTSDKAHCSKPSAEVICIPMQFSATRFPAKKAAVGPATSFSTGAGDGWRQGVSGRQKKSKEEEGAAAGGHCVHRQHAQPTCT